MFDGVRIKLKNVRAFIRKYEKKKRVRFFFFKKKRAYERLWPRRRMGLCPPMKVAKAAGCL